MVQLNSFLEDVIWITKPWRVSSVDFDTKGVVNVELEYMKIQRPKVPECLEYGSLETSYYDMVEKSWRHADMGDQV